MIESQICPEVVLLTYCLQFLTFINTFGIPDNEANVKNDHSPVFQIFSEIRRTLGPLYKRSALNGTR